MYRMLAEYLKEKNIEPTPKYLDLFSFLKYSECYRKKDNQTIKTFCENNSRDVLGLYYIGAGAGLSCGTESLLSELGVNPKEADIIVNNGIWLFDYIINHHGNNYLDDYISFGKQGILDKWLLENAQVKT